MKDLGRKGIIVESVCIEKGCKQLTCNSMNNAQIIFL